MEMKCCLFRTMIPLSFRTRIWHIIAIQFVAIALVYLVLAKYRSPKHPPQHSNNVLKNYIDNAEQALQWMEMSDRLQHLNKNPVYAKFDIPYQKNQSKYTLLIIVSSAPKRFDRRLAIRETWWQQCKSTKTVTIKCIFMTDYPDPSTEIGKKILEEKLKYKDIEFQHLQGGVEFGKRYLYHLIWAAQNYYFDYFMRMDDDYFLCLDRLIKELPLPPQRLYHWGYVHCIPNIVRPEESIIMLSRDLVEMFLTQDPLLIKSHPWADQMIATWVREMHLPKIYNHDPRLHHMPTLLHVKNVAKVFKDVCSRFIGVHGSYPKHMRVLWQLRETKEYPSSSLNEYTQECRIPQVFLWESFAKVWRYKPKRFISNPVWDTNKQDNGKKVYGGREEGKGD